MLRSIRGGADMNDAEIPDNRNGFGAIRTILVAGPELRLGAPPSG
nr:hypothetical protein [Bradyrhizobium diazoefficiens]